MALSIRHTHERSTDPCPHTIVVQVLEKSRIQEVADVQRVSREISILRRVGHKNVIQMYEVLDTGPRWRVPPKRRRFPPHDGPDQRGVALDRVCGASVAGRAIYRRPKRHRFRTDQRSNEASLWTVVVVRQPQATRST